VKERPLGAVFTVIDTIGAGTVTKHEFVLC
jgi:hypothetical protein